MNASTQNLESKKFDPIPSNQSVSAVADAAFDKEQLTVIQQELAANQQHLPERIAATVEEDYQQLLKDFGLR